MRIVVLPERNRGDIFPYQYGHIGKQKETESLDIQI
jgi:hypothetical protein